MIQVQRDNSALTDLKASPQLRAATLQLIEQNFPKGSGLPNAVPAEREFLLLLDPENAARTVILKIDNRVVSSASYRIFDVRIPGASRPLRCAGIGLVVTETGERGQGHSSLVQKEIEERAKKEGCEVAVLWSDLVNFYSERGYVIAGSELQWHLDDDTLRLLGSRLNVELGKSKIEVRPLNSYAEMHQLYRTMGIGPDREARLYTQFFGLPKTWALGAWNKNELVGYAFMGKARDLRDVVHEMGGSREAVGPLLKAMVPKTEKILRVHQPIGTPLKEELEHWLGKSELTPLAFIKVLNPERFGAWIQGAGILPPGIKLAVAGTRFALGQNANVFFESDEPAHLVQLFLGPWKVEEMRDLPALVVKNLAGHKIPPLYFWGFDSV